MPVKPFLCWCLLGISPALFTGCHDSGKKIYPVRGLVRFPDGKVLRAGSVEFESVGGPRPISATGAINPDGSFVLGTYKLDDGAVPGQHRAVVISDHVIGNGAERPGMIPEMILAPKYRAYRTSGLRFEVKPEENDILIEVEYASQRNGGIRPAPTKEAG